MLLALGVTSSARQHCYNAPRIIFGDEVGPVIRKAVFQICLVVLTVACDSATEPQFRTPRVIQAALGYGHGCALTDDGALYCWGLNGAGQVGVPPAADSCQAIPAPFSCVKQPVRVMPSYQFVQVAAGGNFTCAMTADGQVLCWGSNAWGQMGVEEPVGPCPDPDNCRVHLDGVVTPWGADVRQFNAHAGYMCGLDNEGLAVCWGSNDHGQLARQPVMRTLLPPERISGTVAFRALGLGPQHACGVSTQGRAYCWGSNEYGQLGGAGTWLSCYAQPCAIQPVPVAGGMTFSAVVAGAVHSCGLRRDGRAYCWGSNQNGQLGVAGPGMSTTPVAVSGGHRFKALTSGLNYNCALTLAGKAYCWGWRYAGALGDGYSSATGYASAPVAVSGDHTFSSIVAGGESTCGITRYGNLMCWGNNLSGSLGVGRQGIQAVPEWVTLPLPAPTT